MLRSLLGKMESVKGEVLLLSWSFGSDGSAGSGSGHTLPFSVIWRPHVLGNLTESNELDGSVRSSFAKGIM